MGSTVPNFCEAASNVQRGPCRPGETFQGNRERRRRRFLGRAGIRYRRRETGGFRDSPGRIPARRRRRIRNREEGSGKNIQSTPGGLLYLKELKNLSVLYIADTQITDAAVTALKAALPKCVVKRTRYAG